MHGQRAARAVPAAWALAIALLLSSCGTEAVGSVFELSGRVFEEVEGTDTAPIGGATVTFTSDTGFVTTATSSDDGRYQMQVFTDTQFGQVRAEASGYEPRQRTVFFDTPQRRIDLGLRRTGTEE